MISEIALLAIFSPQGDIGCYITVGGHSFSKHARKMGGGETKAYAMRTGWVGTSMCERKNFHFCLYFVAFSLARYFYHAFFSYATFTLSVIC